WKYIGFEPMDDRLRVCGNPISREFLKPLPPYRFNRIALAPLCRNQSSLSRLPLYARINAGSHLLPCLIALFPSLLKTNIGLHAQTQQLFLAPEPVLEAPPHTPVRGNQQIQSAFIEEFMGFCLGLRVPDCGVGQCHFGGNSRRASV